MGVEATWIWKREPDEHMFAGNCCLNQTVCRQLASNATTFGYIMLVMHF